VHSKEEAGRDKDIRVLPALRPFLRDHPEQLPAPEDALDTKCMRTRLSDPVGATIRFGRALERHREASCDMKNWGDGGGCAVPPPAGTHRGDPLIRRGPAPRRPYRPHA
jgi:hypothetical protein